jgi:hypothetical protein
MTAKELIALLQAVPEHAVILVPHDYGRYKDARISVKEIFRPTSSDATYVPMRDSGWGIVFS